MKAECAPPTQVAAQLHDRQPAVLEPVDCAAFKAWRGGTSDNKTGKGDDDPSLILPVE